MSTEKDSESIGLASYLSPSDIRNAVRLMRKIESAKKIEEVLRYQKQLAFLMAKAERNKKLREKMIRRQAMELKKLNKEQIRERIKERYFNSPIKVTEAGIVEEKSEGAVLVEAKAVEETSRTVTRHYQILGDAVEISAEEIKPLQKKSTEKKIPRHFRLKAHNVNGGK